MLQKLAVKASVLLKFSFHVPALVGKQSLGPWSEDALASQKQANIMTTGPPQSSCELEAKLWSYQVDSVVWNKTRLTVQYKTFYARPTEEGKVNDKTNLSKFRSMLLQIYNFNL